MPVAADEGVSEVLVANGLDVLDVDDLSQGAGVYDLLDGGVVGRIPKDCSASQLPFSLTLRACRTNPYRDPCQTQRASETR